VLGPADSLRASLRALGGGARSSWSWLERERSRDTPDELALLRLVARPERRARERPAERLVDEGPFEDDALESAGETAWLARRLRRRLGPGRGADSKLRSGPTPAGPCGPGSD